MSRRKGAVLRETPLEDAECAALARMAGEPHGPAASFDVERGLRRLQQTSSAQTSSAQAASGKRPSRSRPLTIMMTAAAALVAAALVLIWWSRPAPALQLTIGEQQRHGVEGMWLQPASPETLRFSDGTVIRLNAGTRLRVGNTHPARPRLLLEQGGLRAEVMPGTGARWQIHAGPFEVQVTGTVFTIDWRPDDDRFELTLHEGSVELRGPVVGQSRRLAAGERLRIRPHAGRMSMLPVEAETTAAPGHAPAPAPASPTEAASPEAPTGPPPKPATSSPSTRAPSAPAATSPQTASPREGAGWRAALRDGDAAAALARVDRTGVDEILAREPARTLLLLGQTARLHGRPDIASAAFSGLRSRHPGSTEAQTATFLLGKMAFDQGRDVEVTRELRRYLQTAPNGPFAREAEALLMSSLARQGQLSEAKVIATRVLAAAPDGAHATRAREILKSAPKKPEEARDATSR